MKIEQRAYCPFEMNKRVLCCARTHAYGERAHPRGRTKLIRMDRTEHIIMGVASIARIIMTETRPVLCGVTFRRSLVCKASQSSVAGRAREDSKAYMRAPWRMNS